MNYQLIKSLITEVEAFEQQTGGRQQSMQEFASWLDNKFSKAAQEKPLNEVQVSLNTAIGRKVIRLNRYVKLYSKNALQGSLLGSPEEFSYLATLLTAKELKKTDLIQMNIHEKPTGMEIIKRLLRSELISQQNHPTDQRSQLLSITEKGRKELYQVFRKMEHVSNLVGGELSDEEKEVLHTILKKLDDFHQDIFTHQRQDVYNKLRGR